MLRTSTPEIWLQGPLPGFPPTLQPIAHSLLQARLEVGTLMEDFPEELLWETPAGVASPAFHLQHLAGVLDRLFTYAKGQSLTPAQLKELTAEGTTNTEGLHWTREDLLDRFRAQVDKALLQLKETPETSLGEIRGVGRAQIPSTVLGLLFHAAEHVQRHTGQLIVTVRVLTRGGNP